VTTAIGFANPVLGVQGPSSCLDVPTSWLN